MLSSTSLPFSTPCSIRQNTGSSEALTTCRHNKKRKMSYASDKLYNGYLRRNMPTIVRRVQVREIIIHLPCLTAHDRENIEAKRQNLGNEDGMVLLLDCLKRRENWPEQFIEALEACEHTTLAAEIRAEYNALNNSSPGSPPTTVTRAHVHPAPAASRLPVPESGGAKSRAPPAPAAEATPPPTTPQGAAGQLPPPELVPEPPESAHIEVPPPPSTPPPSPETPHAELADVPLQQDELHSDPEPETDDVGSIPDEAELQQQHPDTPPPAVSLQTAERPPQSPTQSHSDPTDGSSFPTMTPEKHPVQDTTPPDNKTSEPSAAKIDESIPETEPAAAASPEPPADETAPSLDDAYLSKPGQLVSVLPPPSPAAPASSQTPEPFSGDTGRLEISEAAADTAISTHTPKYSAPAPPCQENGLNEPEENHYESPNESLLEVVGHVSEEPSILNMDGQTTAPHVPLLNGETAKEAISAAEASANNTGDLPSLNMSLNSSCPPEPAAAAPQSLFSPSTNTKYILTAAGVGACALLMAWRLRK